MEKSKKNKANIDKCIDDALENINNDRAMTMTLLTDLMEYIRGQDERHQHAGPVAAKYLETLQRSNEQLVKISALLHKKNNASGNLTNIDKDEIYSIINNEE